jgi:putative transposase
MKRKRFTEEQIIGIAKEHGLSAKATDLCRKHAFYNWKSRYGGMEVSEAKRLKALEAENTKLKKLLADANEMPDKELRCIFAEASADAL